MDDRRNPAQYDPLIDRMRVMLETSRREDLASMKDYFDGAVEIITNRIAQSHRENEQRWRDHCGPHSDSVHNQEGAKRKGHYAAHEIFEREEFRPLVARVQQNKWTLGAIMAVASAGFTALWAWLFHRFSQP